MHVLFNQLPDEARVWIYASAAPLTQAQQDQITSQAIEFTQQWTAHQMPLKASFIIVDDVFLIFGVDVAHHDISGCGIDKSVHLVQHWEQQMGLTLFNRMQVEYKQINETVAITNKQVILTALLEQQINEHTLVADKTITSMGTFKKQFYIPLAQSWVYKQLMPQTI